MPLRPNLQLQSHSVVLEVNISTYEFEGVHNSAINHEKERLSGGWGEAGMTATEIVQGKSDGRMSKHQQWR